MKLKKVVKTIGKGVETLIIDVVSKAFNFGFKHGTYAYYWFTYPYGDKYDADYYMSNSYDELIDVVDEWIEKMDKKCSEKEAAMTKEPVKCYECIYLGKRGDEYYCNFGDSKHYDKRVDDSYGCFDGERD